MKMKSTRKNFKAKMEKLTIDEIKELMLSTWNESVGMLFREVGFEIIDERVSEEESDEIYDELYYKATA